MCVFFLALISFDEDIIKNNSASNSGMKEILKEYFVSGAEQNRN